jgi:plastocyanin
VQTLSPGFNDSVRANVFECVKLQRLALCASLLAPVAACGSSKSTAEVLVKNYAFPPITATPGEKLKLVDGDDESHTVSADDGSFKFGPFSPKAPGLLVAPTKSGSYPFHCDIHPTMHGTLVVQNS